MVFSGTNFSCKSGTCSSELIDPFTAHFRFEYVPNGQNWQDWRPEIYISGGRQMNIVDLQIIGNPVMNGGSWDSSYVWPWGGSTHWEVGDWGWQFGTIGNWGGYTTSNRPAQVYDWYVRITYEAWDKYSGSCRPGNYNPVQPTPTSPASYCRVVATPAPVVPPIDLPIPVIGPASCTQVGGWTISTSWISSITQLVGITVPEAIGVPGLNVCFRAIRFGALSFLGVSIDLDIIALVMGGVALLRFIMRS